MCDPSTSHVESLLTTFERLVRAQWATTGRGSEHTIRAYLTDTRQHLAWLEEAGLLTPVLRVTTPDMKLYVAWLSERYAITTCRRKLSSLRRFYALAQATSILIANPMLDLPLPKLLPSPSLHRNDHLTPAEYTQLLRTIAMTEPTEKMLRDRLLIKLLSEHDLRPTEALSLDVADVMPDGLVRAPGRVLALPDRTATELRQWLACRALLQPSTAAVFVSLHWGGTAPNGHRLTPRGLRTIVVSHLKRAGLQRPGVTCASLRHPAR